MSSTTLLTIKDLGEMESFTVKVDGIEYELLDIRNFGLIEQARLARYQRLVNALFGDDIPTKEQEQAASAALDDFLKMVLVGIPDEVYAKIPPVSKIGILDAFTYAVDARAIALKEKAAQQEVTATTPQKRTRRLKK